MTMGESRGRQSDENAKTRRSENAKGDGHFYEAGAPQAWGRAPGRKRGKSSSWLPPFLVSLSIGRISRFRSFAFSRSLTVVFVSLLPFCISACTRTAAEETRASRFPAGLSAKESP